MRRIPIGLCLLMNLEELDLTGNLFESTEELMLGSPFVDPIDTPAKVAAYFEQRFGVRRSLLLLCNALRMLALPGLIGILPSFPSSLRPFQSRPLTPPFPGVFPPPLPPPLLRPPSSSTLPPPLPDPRFCLCEPGHTCHLYIYIYIYICVF